jgi:hypothetical protein
MTHEKVPETVPSEVFLDCVPGWHETCAHRYESVARHEGVGQIHRYVLASVAERIAYDAVAEATAPMILSEDASVAAVRGLLTAQQTRTEAAEARIAALEEALGALVADIDCDGKVGWRANALARNVLGIEESKNEGHPVGTESGRE